MKPIQTNSLRIALPIAAAILLAYGALRLQAITNRFKPSSEPIIGAQKNGTYLVPTGQTLTPAGKNITFDSRPLDMALSPDGKTLALMLPGEIRLFDTVQGSFRSETIKGGHTFGGIVWSHDGSTLYATGKLRGAEDGGDNTVGIVDVFRVSGDGTVTAQKPLRFPFQSRIQPNKAASNALPTGLAIAANDKTLYVSLFNNGTVAAVDLSSYDSTTGAAKMVETQVGSSPERIAFSPNGDKIYVANRGGKTPQTGDTLDNEDPVVVDPKTYKVATGTITVLRTADMKVLKNIRVGLQPADMCFSPNGRFLYVANANSDSLSVIRTVRDTVIDTIPTSPAPKRLAASSPNGIAVAPNGATLFVTLGGDNAVELITLDQASGGKTNQTRIAGLIPTAWFPLGVTLSRDGKKLYVANSKGIGSLGELATRKRPRNGGAATAEAGPGGVVDNGDFKGHSVYNVLGSLEAIAVPNAATLKNHTAQVAQNNHFDRMAKTIAAKPDPFWSRFKHVIFVIKENRTYDQVFGDIPLGSGHIGGDPKLVMFGKKVTPNHHALALEFGLFDNLYCSGAISADGHHWLNEAFADDYDERAMNNYPRSYPCCGSDPLSFAGNSFIWQSAMAAGKSFYNYGEFAPLPSIKPHSDNDYDQRIPPTADRNRDVAHVERILSDLKAGKKLAQLTMAWFGNDHTSGTTPGAFTPEACVADNDLAVGKLVEAISHSKKYWHDEPTAIFVVEDDAQGGLDHIEGHRTVGLVISPFNKRGQIVSTNYNQLNMLATVERMLNLKPLNQFDAAAVTMRPIFQERSDFRPYTAEAHQIALNERNPSVAQLQGSAKHWAKVSSALDFSKPDRADPEKVTEILWHHTHGDAAYPPATAAVR